MNELFFKQRVHQIARLRLPKSHWWTRIVITATRHTVSAPMVKYLIRLVENFLLSLFKIMIGFNP